MKLLIGLQIIYRSFTASMIQGAHMAEDGPGSPPSHAQTDTQDKGVVTPTPHTPNKRDTE